MALDATELALLQQAAADAKAAQATAVEARVAARNAVRALDDVHELLGTQQRTLDSMGTDLAQTLEAVVRLDSSLAGVVIIAVQRIDGGPVVG